jgi:hypothetical protein
VVLPDSHAIPGVACYLGKLSTGLVLPLRDYHPLRYGFPTDFTFNKAFSLCNRPAERFESSHNPNHATPAGYHTQLV